MKSIESRSQAIEARANNNSVDVPSTRTRPSKIFLRLVDFLNRIRKFRFLSFTDEYMGENIFTSFACVHWLIHILVECSTTASMRSWVVI